MEPVSSSSVAPRTDSPKPGTRWRHSKGTYYTVLIVSNGASKRQDEYPTTVVYQNDKGEVWSRPLALWHASMTQVKTARAATITGYIAEMPEVPLTEHLAKWGAQLQTSPEHYKTCGHCGGFEALVGMKWRLYQTQQALRRHQADSLALKQECAELTAQALAEAQAKAGSLPEDARALMETLAERAKAPVDDNPLATFNSSQTRDEIAAQFKLLVDSARAKAQQNTAKQATLVVFEWLTAMWTAVCTLENRAASVAERRAAAVGLRNRLENEIASPEGRKPVAAQLRSPEEPANAPWHELPLAEVTRAENNGYEVRHLFDHAEGSPVVAVLHKQDGAVKEQLIAGAQYLEDGVYALHALSISPTTAAALLEPPSVPALPEAI